MFFYAKYKIQYTLSKRQMAVKKKSVCAFALCQCFPWKWTTNSDAVIVQKIDRHNNRKFYGFSANATNDCVGYATIRLCVRIRSCHLCTVRFIDRSKSILVHFESAVIYRKGAKMPRTIKEKTVAEPKNSTTKSRTVKKTTKKQTNGKSSSNCNLKHLGMKKKQATVGTNLHCRSKIVKVLMLINLIAI